MVGKIVDVGAYLIEDDSWVGSSAGVLAGFSSSPGAIGWVFEGADPKSPDVVPTETHYILVTVVDDDA